jgi:hypothetical protein
VGALVVFAGPFRFVGLVVVAIEIAVLLVIHRRYGRDPLRWLTPIPPREGTSRSGAPMVEAFFRVRDDIRDRFA